MYKADSPRNQSDERAFSLEQQYSRHYDKETLKNESYADLNAFCRGLARAADVRSHLETTLDLPRYINYLCASAFCQNWDAFNKNHFIGFDRENSSRWFALPWDLDRTLGDGWNWTFDEYRLPVFLGTADQPGPTGWNRLADRFFSDQSLRQLYLNRLQHLLEETFTESKLWPEIERLEQSIANEADLDRAKWGGNHDWRNGLYQVKTYVKNRREFLLGELNRLR